MKRNIFFISAAFLIFFSGAASAFGDFKSLNEALPAHSSELDIVRHIGYALKYDEQFEQADWVIYELTAGHLNGNVPRRDNFRPDTAVKTGSSKPEDYRGSGYDRGHLAPAGDMKWSSKAMSESFFMSNMSPQKHEFNAGIWEQLESQVREWAKENGEVYVVTGPVLKENLPRIGIDRVAVPEYYYKIILDYKQPEYKAIAFVMPNRAAEYPLQNYVVTIDSVQLITGIDFFPALPDSMERTLESTVQPALWHLGGAVLAAGSLTPEKSNKAEVSNKGKEKIKMELHPALILVIIAVSLLAVGVALWLFLHMTREMLRHFRKRK
jgi:endonuclease G, mitochondrial